MVEHHLAKVRVAGSNPVSRSLTVLKGSSKLRGLRQSQLEMGVFPISESGGIGIRARFRI